MEHAIGEHIKHETFLEESQQIDKQTHTSSSSFSRANVNRTQEENMECNENAQFSNMSNTVIIHCSKDDVPSCIRKCASCRKSINTESYLSWELMDFCNESCVSKMQRLASSECVYCSRFISVISFGKYYVRVGKELRLFCTKTCLDDYKLTVKFCSYCQEDIFEKFSVGLNQVIPNRIAFCSQACCERFNSIIQNAPPKVPPDTKCSVCQRDKPVTIVLKHDRITNYFCSKQCLIAYSFVKLQMGAEKCLVCQNYFSRAVIENTLFYENVQLNFCSNTCQNIYVLMYSKPVSCNFCQNKRYNFGMIRKYSRNCPSINKYLCSVNCLRGYHMSTEARKESTTQDARIHAETIGIPAPQAPAGPPTIINTPTILPTSLLVRSNPNVCEIANNPLYLPIQTKQQFLVQSATRKIEQRNVATMCCIPKADKSSMTQQSTRNKGTQTDGPSLKDILIPVPIPLHVPVPMAMYSYPVPVPVPFPVPIPIPIFIPTSRKSMAGIAKEIEKITVKIPNDPYEAELLEIANVIAEDKKVEDDSESEEEESTPGANDGVPGEKSTGAELNPDAEKISLAWDLNDVLQREDSDVPDNLSKGKKRSHDNLAKDNAKRERTPSSFQQSYSDIPWIDKTRLNYTLGINAWKQWVRQKNCFSGRSSKSIGKPFKTDILQMLPDELNYALCMFIKELRKPNDSDYAPDTLYYLCLGIQYYLYQNGRNDNIFQDAAFSTFVERLDELVQKFCALYDDDSHFIVTRVEEEHLWEVKQLGCHSPQVLLNTLVYFNTKYYLTSTVEQHMEISFFQVLKAWKKQAKSKILMIRFCPKNPKNNVKRVCEQYEDKSNHSRCPVRLYEFYLSKCPESVRNRHDLFYLQPEKYCIPDSPLWYTTSSIPTETLAKMINRVKMVKEINIALLSSN